MSKNMSVRWGETLPLTIEDEDGSTATITVSQGDTFILSKTASFIDGVADLTLTALQTEIEEGVYSYMYTIIYTDGTKLKYPDVSNCSDCELPTLTICQANDSLEVS